MSDHAAGPLTLPDDAIPRRAWLALSVSTLVVFLVVIDISAVNVAFPSIRTDFAVTDSELSWMIGAYNVAVGALLMVSGRLADSISDGADPQGAIVGGGLQRLERDGA